MTGASSLTFFSIGHSNRPLPDFLALLAESRVEGIVDVRSLPGSRAFPQYDADALAGSLAQEGRSYVHMPALGGRRGRSLPADDMRNALWRNASFRRYADYALSPAFALALDQLEARALQQRCALMCAEAVWWRCHRRIIADHLLARGHDVFHIMGPGKVIGASLTPGACVCDGEVTYPPAGDAPVSGSRT